MLEESLPSHWSEAAALVHVASMLGVNDDTLRGWNVVSRSRLMVLDEATGLCRFCDTGWQGRHALRELRYEIDHTGCSA
jgi:hypothetical protein